ncbi:MAG: hypothetical protein D3925_16655 [Candidatus Electrothrix sp. AR5]|nr:hypothetical protein [Candidatus Electrothrix sp. AR5]
MPHTAKKNINIMFENIPEGSRKVILTKWMLIIFSLGTFGYYFLLGREGMAPPDSFFMNFVFGLGAIGGAFTVGNIFEHRAKSDQKIEELRHSESGVRRAQAEAQKAQAEIVQSPQIPE